MPTIARHGRRTGATLIGLCALAGSLVAATPQDAAASGPAARPGSHAAAPARNAAPAPQVVHTGTGPTGYQVTFHFKAPDAKSVRIKGEWYFANPYELSSLAGTPTSVVQTPGTTPQHWKPGDIPIGSPNSSAANWPVAVMTEDKHTGVWSYTVPLPSGVFNYGFYVDCADPAQTGCTEVSDPGNPPWNQTGSRTAGSVESVSQVYVPSDPKFRTADLAWQAPIRQHGTLRDVTYPAPTSITPPGRNYLAVYTPPGYDPERAKPYPTVYLNSGGSNEMDWSTQGDLGNILDNLITTGEIQPMVVVMPNTDGFPASDSYASFDADLVDSVIPYVESHYRVSTSVAQRAIGGLGYGASITNSFLFDDPSHFAYYGVMSPGINGDFTLPDAASLTAGQIAAMKKVGILVGGGWQDPSHYYHAGEADTLVEAGVGVAPDYVDGGHSWYAWRLLVRDFLTRVAFFPPLTG